MGFIIGALVCMVGFAGLFYLASVVFGDGRPMFGLEELEGGAEPAFEGGAALDSLSPERVAEIKPLIDRAGLVSLGERGKRENQVPITTFEVYVLDTNGVAHTVERVQGHNQAAELARKVSSIFNVPLDDPDFITAGR